MKKIVANHRALTTQGILVRTYYMNFPINQMPIKQNYWVIYLKILHFLSNLNISII